MSVILTSELEAEVTAIYQEIRAAQASTTVVVERETLIEQSTGPRMLAVCFALVAIVLLIAGPAWAVVEAIRRSLWIH